jgi:hypothetical protein
MMLTPRMESTGRYLRKILEIWALRFFIIGIILIIIENTHIAGSLLNQIFSFDATQTDHFIFEIGIAFTVAAFLIFTSERQLKTEMEETFTKYLETIRTDWNSDLTNWREDLEKLSGSLERESIITFRAFSHVHRLSHFLGDVHERTNKFPEIYAVAKQILAAYAPGLEAKEDGFLIEDRNWTMDMMRRFYSVLQDSRWPDANLEIRVTHPGLIGIWQNLDEVRDTLGAQRDLVINKNICIHRIFVGTTSIVDASDDKSEYAKVMANMSDYKILGYYVQRDNPRAVKDVTWIPALGIFTEWFARDGGNIGVVNLKFDANDRANLERMWQGLKDDINSGRGFVAKRNAEIIEELRARQC